MFEDVTNLDVRVQIKANSVIVSLLTDCYWI